MDEIRNLRRCIYNVSKKTGKGAIYIYYSNSGNIKRFRTGVKIDSTKWDVEKCKPKRGALNKDAEDIVDILYATLLKLITDYQFKFRNLPPISYLESNLKKPEPLTNIHELFQEFINTKKVNKGLAKGSISYYEYSAKRLKEVDKYFKYNLNLQNFNYTFIELFIKYCKTVKVLNNNTIKQRIDVFKSFSKYLDKKEIKNTININSWDKLNKEQTEMLCLEKNELNEILKYAPKSVKEQKIKDIIVFLSHTGMRKSDMANISKDNVVENILVFTPQKTKRSKIVCKVPISSPVLEILVRLFYQYI